MKTNLMNLVLTALILAFVLTGCGTKDMASVERCGETIWIGPRNTMAEGINYYAGKFTVTQEPNTLNQTWTSVADPSCSFKVIDFVVQ